MSYIKIRGLSKKIFQEIIVPSDKSISHRAIIISSLAEGTTVIQRFLLAEDTLNTLKIFQELGVDISINGDEIIVIGKGLQGLSKPEKILDVGNSGTGIRLILGVLAGQAFESEITGDESIQKRPMKRVVNPLSLRGAKFFSKNSSGEYVKYILDSNITAPIFVKGNPELEAFYYKMPISSAQVKSCLLFSGLYSDAQTAVLDPGFSRDHTEVMLELFGVDIKTIGNKVIMNPPQKLVSPGKIVIPADISSAAFWMVFGCIYPNSEIILNQVGLNPTRTGIITVLQNMGADIVVEEDQNSTGEKFGKITVKSSSLVGSNISGDLIPLLIDEIPIISVAAAFAKGKTVIKNAKELRVKESDRIKTTLEILTAFGVECEELEDGLIITGGCKLNPSECQSYGDHRIAMSAIIMSLCLDGESTINNIDCINTSYPSFLETVNCLSN